MLNYIIFIIYITKVGFHYKSFIKSFKNKTNIYFNVIEEVLIYLDQKKDNYLNNLEVIRSNNYNSIKPKKSSDFLAISVNYYFQVWHFL